MALIHKYSTSEEAKKRRSKYEGQIETGHRLRQVHPDSSIYIDEVVDCDGIDLHKIPEKALRAIEREKIAVDANKALFNDGFEFKSIVFEPIWPMTPERRTRKSNLIQTDADALTAEALGF